MWSAAKSIPGVERFKFISAHNDTASVKRETCLTSFFNMFGARRQKRCCLILVAFKFILLVIYITGYTPLLYGGDPGIVRPRIPFEDIAQHQEPMKPRIMVTWYGRMGNHMFQYSCLIGVSKRNNMTPIIPPNIDLLDVFNLPTAQGSLSLLRDPIRYPDEKVAKYDNTTEHLVPNRDAFLDGYHQSWKYYEHVKEELLTKHFVFHAPIMAKAKSYIQQARQELNKADAILVGVHIRRGDFVRQRIKGFTAAPIPFYYKSMNYFRRKYKNVLFMMCTNDIFWAQDNLDQGPDVFYNSNLDGAVDLAILTSCDHVIITSGSFSWWAGYLVRGDVVYYGGYPEPNTKIGNLTVREDYYPPYWIPM